MSSRKSSVPKGPPATEGVAPLHLADSRQAALLLLRTVELRTESRKAKGLKAMTRAQLTVPMLKRLWNRPRLSPEFICEVTDWLLVGGWAFFDAGRFYAMVRVTAVENWPRLSTKAMREDDHLDDVATGKYPFANHEHLLWRDEASVDDAGEDADDKTSATTGSDDE